MRKFIIAENRNMRNGDRMLDESETQAFRDAVAL